MNISNIKTSDRFENIQIKSFDLAVTLTSIRQVTEVVINECRISQRQTIKAKRKPINVDDHAFKFA
jgi:hypothetical protein